ncbi:hypothetical protein Aduo_011916 [Ancylostoma duodenale]
MFARLFQLFSAIALIPAVFSIVCYKGTVSMTNNQYPQGTPEAYDCGAFVQFCTKNLLNQRQQNWDTLTTIVYGCDAPYTGTCRYDGCTYSLNGGASCCCDSYLCNGTPGSKSVGAIILTTLSVIVLRTM